MTVLARDWTGSGSERREQGGCCNYGTMPRRTEQWLLPAGLAVSVCRVEDDDRQWRKHTLRRDVFFRQPEQGSSGAIVIREDGWFILSRWEHVQATRAGSQQGRV